jgi:hypothetical protein
MMRKISIEFFKHTYINKKLCRMHACLSCIMNTPDLCTIDFKITGIAILKQHAMMPKMKMSMNLKPHLL